MKNKIYLLLGWVAFGVGFAGIFVPLLPTVVFWILAAWLFTNSAPHLREKICSHPRFGAMIRAFLDHGVLNRRGKMFSVIGIMGSVGLSLSLWTPAMPIMLLIIGVVLGVVFWLLRRPEVSPDENNCAQD